MDMKISKKRLKELIEKDGYRVTAYQAVWLLNEYKTGLKMLYKENKALRKKVKHG